MRPFVSGYIPVQLPKYITDCKCVLGLVKNSKNQPYKDHLCAFRCLADHAEVEYSSCSYLGLPIEELP